MCLILTAVAAWGQITAVNGASFLPGKPVSAGAFATVFGENLCANTAVGQWIAPGELPTSLADCSVRVSGIPAMLSFVSPAQVNFIVPSETQTGTAEIVITSGANTTTGSVVVGRASPGVFSTNGLGMGEGAILHGTAWHRGPFSVTTDGQPTPVTIFLTGVDLSTKPVVTIGGVAVEPMFWGAAPGYAGLQQINVMLPATLAGVGRVPVVVTSGDQVSNVTYITLLPTTLMMNGMPNWVPGKAVKENSKRGREVSFMAMNAVNNTVLVTDEDDDSVRVISLETGTTLATIALPDGSEPRHIVVNDAGTLAAVSLSEKSAVALIDLAGGTTQVVSVLSSGVHPGHLAFAGANLLATYGGSSLVAVIDTTTRAVTRTVQVGFGPGGIAVAGNQAVVANMQAGSLSIIDLTTWAVTTVALPDGVRPQAVAIAGTNAIVTSPMNNAFFLLDLGTRQVTRVEIEANAKGPGAVTVYNSLVFIANQTSSSVTAFNASTGAVVKTFAVDPGPRALAVNAARNQLLVLCEGTGTIAVVDLASYAVVNRLDAGETVKTDRWTLPAATSLTPASALVGETVTMVIAGTNLKLVKSLEFQMASGGNGQGQGHGRMRDDDAIKVTNLQVNDAGTSLSATVQVLGTATPGVRQVRLETERTEVAAGTFTVK